MYFQRIKKKFIARAHFTVRNFIASCTDRKLLRQKFESVQMKIYGGAVEYIITHRISKGRLKNSNFKSRQISKQALKCVNRKYINTISAQESNYWML